MKKILAVIISVTVILLAVSIFTVLYTPYNVPLISQLFPKETIEEPKISDTEELPVATTSPDEGSIEEEDVENVDAIDEEEVVVEVEPEPEASAEREEPIMEEVIPIEEEEFDLEPEPETTREPQEYIVEIYSFTDWRLSSITVYEGDTVTFINLDDELHWPGSDPHPTHSSLPLFDALGGISEGQSYSHTFTVPGTYGHHDHLPEDPPTLGIVTVLPAE